MIEVTVPRAKPCMQAQPIWDDACDQVMKAAMALTTSVVSGTGDEDESDSIHALQ